MTLLILLKVIGVLVFRQKEVAIKSASPNIHKLVRYIVEYLIFFLKLLQLLVELVKLKCMYLILLGVLWKLLQHTLSSALLLLVHEVLNLWVVTSFPFSRRKPQKLLASHLVHLVVTQDIYIALFTAHSVVYFLGEEILNVIDQGSKIPIGILRFESIRLNIAEPLVPHVSLPELLQNLPMVCLRVVLPAAISCFLI